MKRALLIFAAVLSFSTFNLASAASSRADNTQGDKSDNELTGKDLPTFIQESRKQLCKDLPGECVQPEQIRYVKNMDVFFAQHCITDPKDQAEFRQLQAFVLGSSFPIYINSDDNRFRNVEKLWPQVPALVIAMAGTIRHERVHALGQKEELPGYAAELDYLRMKESRHQFPNGEAYLAKVQDDYNSVLRGEQADGALVVKASTQVVANDSKEARTSPCAVQMASK